MKIVKVTYTTKAEYAEQNKTNISKVMADLQAIGNGGLNYNTCLMADGKTFIHTAFFRDEAAQKTLSELPSFKQFQEQLKMSQPEAAPQQESLSLVGTSTNIFN